MQKEQTGLCSGNCVHHIRNFQLFCPKANDNLIPLAAKMTDYISTHPVLVSVAFRKSVSIYSVESGEVVAKIKGFSKNDINKSVKTFEGVVNKTFVHSMPCHFLGLFAVLPIFT